MRPDTRRILNDPSLVAARDAHMARLVALFGGARPQRLVRLWGLRGKGSTDPYRDVERWTEEALDDVAAQADVLRDARAFRPLAFEFGPYGVHFIDRMFGAHVFALEPDNWQVQPLTSRIGDLRPPELAADDTWRLARRIAEAFLSTDVAVPLFGLPTIASALNIAVNLYGQEILVAMRSEPAAAGHDLAIINDLLCALHRWYLEHIPLAQLQPVIAAFRTQPPGYGQLCGCTTHLVSAELYRDMVAPLDDALLSVYPHGGMIHLCGAHAQHIPTFRAMPSLRAVQLNDRAADDLELYYQGLRDDQVIYVNAYEGMPVDRILAITGGHRTIVVADPDAGEG